MQREGCSDWPESRKSFSTGDFAGKGSLVTTTGDTTYDNDDLDDAIFRSFLRFFRSFVRFFVRSKIFQKIGRVAAMILVQKSSKSELSSRFFGRLKIKKKISVFFFVGGVLEVVSAVLVMVSRPFF